MNRMLAQLLPSVSQQPYPLLFVTLSGSHLYGFSSPDSDYDLRGVHVLPLPEVVGLDGGRETIEQSQLAEKLALDLVTHDIKKFFSLLLKKNGYVLEQLYSPLVVYTTPAHEELKAIAQGCITRHHSHHYLGFAQTQWRLWAKQTPRRVKPLLYVYRVLLSGIHLMQTGEVEANLLVLNQRFGLPYLLDLVAQKQTGTEQAVLSQADEAFHEQEYDRLCQTLAIASQESSLPEVASVKQQLNDLLVRVRMDSR